MKAIIQKQKTDRTKQLILGGALVVVMFFSVLGYAFQGKEDDNSKKITYNGFKFVNQNGFWYLNVGQFQFAFKHNPKEVEKIDSELEYLDNYYGKPIYISSESNEAGAEIYQNLFYRNQIVQRIQFACLDEEECEENLPIKTCLENFIIIKKSNNTEITQNESCVFIEGPLENLTKITDEFLFKILGIEQ